MSDVFGHFIYKNLSFSFIYFLQSFDSHLLITV